MAKSPDRFVNRRQKECLKHVEEEEEQGSKRQKIGLENHEEAEEELTSDSTRCGSKRVGGTEEGYLYC